MNAQMFLKHLTVDSKSGRKGVLEIIKLQPQRAFNILFRVFTMRCHSNKASALAVSALVSHVTYFPKSLVHNRSTIIHRKYTSDEKRRALHVCLMQK